MSVHRLFTCSAFSSAVGRVSTCGSLQRQIQIYDFVFCRSWPHLGRGRGRGRCCQLPWVST
eukprot:657146-Pyramimonas_sp.AAC.1